MLVMMFAFDCTVMFNDVEVKADRIVRFVPELLRSTKPPRRNDSISSLGPSAPRHPEFLSRTEMA